MPKAKQQTETEDQIFSPIKGSPGINPGENSDYGWRPDYGRNHNGVDIATPAGTPCIAPGEGKIVHTSTTGFGDSGGMIHLQMTAKGARVTGLNEGDIIGWGHIQAAHVNTGRTVQGGTHIADSGWHHVHFIYQPGGRGGLDGTADPEPIYNRLKNGKQATGADGGVTDDGSADGVAANLDQIMTATKAAAFGMELQFPGIEERNEAFALQGQKSLLNDRPLFDFIQQLTGACMRDFMSLPNGDFYAFYPNYFGTFESRKPYWNIYNIELTEGTMDLTDDTLATHVYVVGDTIGQDGSIDMMERLLTSGAVTIHNIAQAGFKQEARGKRLTETNNKSDEEGKDEKQTEEALKALNMTDVGQVADFLGRYGARPYYEEAPNVRNPFYESFLAYQRFQLLWSEQFATTFRFTFMPELYPSGIIAFPEHDLQCYIEEVTHTFDYESGFTTDAVLVAPATTSSDPDADDPMQHGLVRAGPAGGDGPR
jgi:hypothetical protein